MMSYRKDLAHPCSFFIAAVIVVDVSLWEGIESIVGAVIGAVLIAIANDDKGCDECKQLLATFGDWL